MLLLTSFRRGPIMFILQIIFIFSEEVSIMFILNLFGYPF